MLSSSVKKAWQINTRINRNLLEHLTAEMLTVTTPAGGFTVAEHLVEIIYTPKYFGLKFDAVRLEPIPNLFSEGDKDEYVFETDLKTYRAVARQTAETVLAVAEEASDKGELPHASIDVYLIHMMAHDAHHRGQLLLALKNAGYALPGDDKIWSPWKEG